MPQYIRGFAERSAEPSEMGTPIRFIASTEAKARDGLVIEARGWQLDEFLANPAVLWSHDYRGERPPIGRAENVWIDGDRLMADISFDQDDPFAVAIEKKYRKGVLNSVSVGWDSVEVDGNRVTAANLLDISAVNVPGDPGALMERQARAFRDLGEALLDIIPDDEAAETRGIEAQMQWEGTALRMVRLFLSGIDDDFDEREYKRLERHYRTHGKTAPEVPANLSALDMATVRGLFVEGEPDLVPEAFTVPEPAREPEPEPDQTADILARLYDALKGTR